jgi:hypothetical protein
VCAWQASKRQTWLDLECPLLFRLQLRQTVELKVGGFLPRSLRIEPSVNMHSGALSRLVVVLRQPCVGGSAYR